MQRNSILVACSLALASPSCGEPDGSSSATDTTTSESTTTSAASSSTGTSTDAGTASTAATTSPTTGESTGGSTGGGSTGGAVGPGCAGHVAFADINATIFSGCGGYIACHTKGPYGGQLALSDDPAVSYAALVGVASTIAPSELRVAPGDSAHSLLYKKLIDDLAADDSEGGPMPKTMTAMMWSRLPDEQIEMVRCWIDEGAPND